MPQLAHTYNASELIPVYPDTGRTMAVKLKASIALAAGTVISQNSTTGLWEAYADAGANGVGTARAVLQFPVATDASGIHTYGAQAGGEWGERHQSCPAYYAGVFRAGDITGLDANGITDLNARYITGGTTAAEDLLHIP